MRASQEPRKTRVAGCLACLGAAVVFVAALVVLHFALLDGLHGNLGALLLGEDTQYSPGYSDRGFRAVKVGMQSSEVERLLGQPMYRLTNSGDENYWVYSDEGPRNSHYRVRRLNFDGLGRVDKKVSRFSRFSR